jgi:Siphovirus Gp157
MQFYEAAAALREILDAIDPETGELPPDLAWRMASLNLTFDSQLDSICAVLVKLRSIIETARDESKRLAELARIREGNADRLKAYLLDSLHAAGVKKHETGRFKVWEQASPPAMKCIEADLSKIDPEFRRVSITADLAAAKDAWKRTGEVPAGFAVSQSSHLRIK